MQKVHLSSPDTSYDNIFCIDTVGITSRGWDILHSYGYNSPENYWASNNKATIVLDTGRVIYNIEDSYGTTFSPEYEDDYYGFCVDVYGRVLRLGMYDALFHVYDSYGSPVIHDFFGGVHQVESNGVMDYRDSVDDSYGKIRSPRTKDSFGMCIVSSDGLRRPRQSRCHAFLRPGKYQVDLNFTANQITGGFALRTPFTAAMRGM